MEEKLKALYIQEVVQSHLDFERDPEYQFYYTQAESLWKGGDMPIPIYRLLESSSSLAFAHGFRLGMQLVGWMRTG